MSEEVKTVRVQANVNTCGLAPGQVAEIELTSLVSASVGIGHLTVLVEAAEEPQEASEPAEAPVKAEEAPKPSQRRSGAKKSKTGEAETETDGEDVSE